MNRKQRRSRERSIRRAGGQPEPTVMVKLVPKKEDEEGLNLLIDHNMSDDFDGWRRAVGMLEMGLRIAHAQAESLVPENAVIATPDGELRTKSGLILAS